MIKLIIQIPCYNEADTLPATLAELPREIPGVDIVEWLVVDDGSTDDTRSVALANGVDHVVGHKPNRGLAVTFMAGLNACLERGADIIVNTDADNQYSSAYIEDLVRPILQKNADLVVGSRPISDIEYFSPVKKALQKLGSWTMRHVSSTEISDAPSGFRAMNREAAMRMNVFNSYTYTLETLIQAGHANIQVLSVPVEVNEQTRESRLVKSIASYVKKSMTTIIRMFVVYNPLKFFMTLGGGGIFLGLLLCFRWLALYYMGTPRTHMPSLMAATIFIIGGGLFCTLGILGDLLAVNRKILEDIRYRVRKIELNDAERGSDEDSLR